jgi:hypothetical protein
MKISNEREEVFCNYYDQSTHIAPEAETSPGREKQEI